MNEENLFQTIISACLEATGMSQFSHEITKAEKMCVCGWYGTLHIIAKVYRSCTLKTFICMPIKPSYQTR